MKKSFVFLFSLLLLAACGEKGEKETEVLIETSVGNIKVKLFNDTPRHRDNFIRLAREGVYDGVMWHRIVPNLMIQTGDPTLRPGHQAVTADTAALNYTVPQEIRFPKYIHRPGMLAAARQVQAMGGFPHDYAQIRSLRGVGDYIAAAVASFAFDAPYAVLDGNVYRVLARVFGIDTPIDTLQGQREFRALADEMLPRPHAARYNQAIMDFGAVQCTPHAPDCAVCPMAGMCVARVEARVGQLPAKRRRTAVHDRFFTYFYLRRPDGRVLLQRRSGGDIWQGLYQFPLVESPQPLTPAEVERLSPQGRITLGVEDLTHLLSHQRLHAACYVVELSATQEVEMPGIWVGEASFGDYAMPRLLERMLEKIRPMFGADVKKV